MGDGGWGRIGRIGGGSFFRKLSGWLSLRGGKEYDAHGQNCIAECETYPPWNLGTAKLRSESPAYRVEGARGEVEWGGGCGQTGGVRWV